LSKNRHSRIFRQKSAPGLFQGKPSTLIYLLILFNFIIFWPGFAQLPRFWCVWGKRRFWVSLAHKCNHALPNKCICRSANQSINK
jgi:hypothetical protein